MKEILVDTLIDAIKLIPFLFIAFLIIEIIEHKINNEKIIKKSKSIGPLLGSLLGLFPQCGFSVMATNLYITRIISLGTLISIYLTTSDEMLPVMLSNKVEASIIVRILLLKFLFGIIYGFLIDFILRKKNTKNNINTNICKNEHCNCDHNLINSVLKHTFNTLLFIIIITLLLNTFIYYYGESFLNKIFLNNSMFAPFITSLIGLIPNCASSVILTELFIGKAISFSSLISGLLTNSGVGILVLFKSNKNIKENIFILLLIYFLGALSGLLVWLI